MSSPSREIRDYLDRMQAIQTALLELIEAETDKDNKYQKLFYVLDDIKEDNNLLKSFLHLLMKVSKNHRRLSDHFTLVENIINSFKEDIQKYYSNSEIFTMFKGNRRILLYLLKTKMLKIDDFVYKKMQADKYTNFFSPELKSYIEKDSTEAIPEIFENKRTLGQNDWDLCEIIRNDSVDEFKAYIERNRLKPTKEIINSNFETNQFLIDNNPTIIEYAVFFGSINIFKYLKTLKIEFKPSLWLYAIHSQNIEIIQNLVELKLKPEDKSYKKCFEEAVKCHHNEIANFILSNLMKNKENQSQSVCLQFYNFQFIKRDFINKNAFIDLCSFDYQILVDILVKSENIDINARKSYTVPISKINFFNVVLKLIFFMEF